MKNARTYEQNAVAEESSADIVVRTIRFETRAEDRRPASQVRGRQMETAASVILRARHVVDLQYFLMDAAKRYVLSSDSGVAGGDDLLASAAALDYALLVSSEQRDEPIPEDAAIVASGRDTIRRSVGATLDFIEEMLQTPPDTFADFVDRHVRPVGIFDTLRGLRADGALEGDDLAFRTLALAHEVAERRQNGRLQ
jgi:hypothetical protein